MESILEEYNKKYAEYEKARDQLWEVRDRLTAQDKTAKTLATIRTAQKTIKQLRKFF